MNKKDRFYKFQLNITLANIISIIELVILLVINHIFNIVDFDKVNILVAFIGILIYTGIHEFFHGISFYIFSKEKDKIKYGVLLEKGVFYAACQSEISKIGILISLLFPLFFLTIVPLPFALLYNVDMLTILALYNFLGAIGDILMTLFIICLPKNTRYIDYDITVGATFISDVDLSKYSGKVMKLIDSGKHDKKNIDNSIKRFYISKDSIKIFVGLTIIFLISFLVDMV